MADENISLQVTDKPKKRKVFGRKSNKNQHQKLSGHVTGRDCHCARHQCYTNVTKTERSRIIAHFNSLESKTEQDAVLSNLIDILPVKQRRSRKDDCNQGFHDFSYQYNGYLMQDDTYTRVSVCCKAFCAIFGITRNRVRTVRAAIAMTGKEKHIYTF